MSDQVAVIAVPVVAIVCCLALLLALLAGAGGLALIAGAGLPLVVLAAIGAWLVARRRTRSDRG